MNNSEIAILLPYKENFNFNEAGSASLWVKDFFLNSKLKSKTTIYGINHKKKSLTKNFCNLKFKMPKFYLSRNKTYAETFYKVIIDTRVKVIEIHNRPEVFNYLVRKNLNCKYILVFHNNPNELRGSKTVHEKNKILQYCDALIFVSHFTKKQFFYNLKIKDNSKAKVIYPSIRSPKKISYKEKLITFFGKLNHLKGYDIFGEAIINILNKHNDWKAVVAGDEKKEKYNFKHKNLKIYNWLNHKRILKILSKSSICIVPSTWDEPFGRIAMEASNFGNATIISRRGGLTETSNHCIKLKEVNSKEIINKIETLILNKNRLLKIQKLSFNNPKIIFSDNIYKLDNIKYKLLN